MDLEPQCLQQVELLNDFSVVIQNPVVQKNKKTF